MEVRDPVHGSINVSEHIRPVLQNPFFQRLRNIKQLGFSEYVFPGASHTRYLHSIGVMSIAEKVFDKIFYPHRNKNEFIRLKESLKLACLLHDIGHAPLSHTTEFAMPNVSSLNLPPRFINSHERQADHEDYTVKTIIDSSLTESFKNSALLGVSPEAVAELVLGRTSDSNYFIIEGIDYFPLLHQLVSSEMDCDRMDYLLRDSYFCGVSYGHYDLDWLIDNLTLSLDQGQAFLGISERAVSTFDDFLLSRFHMFIMVYFHYRPVCLEQMLLRYLEETNHEYRIPGDIESYREHDDYFLMKVLKSSSNEWAQRIVQNNIVPKLFESYGHNSDDIYQNLKYYLDSENIDYLHCPSIGRLSKYYSDRQNKSGTFPMKVVHQYGSKQSSNIEDVTDLFNKYSHSHTVSRIYCAIDQVSPSQKREISAIIKGK